jgi:hypothetical protein
MTLRSGLIVRPEDLNLIVLWWELGARCFQGSAGEPITYASNTDLAALMRLARGRYGVQKWDVWLDAEHAPAELRFTGVSEGGRVFTIRQVVA